MNVERRQQWLDIIDRKTDLPMALLSILIVPLIVVPLTVNLSAAAAAAFVALDVVIWLVFGVELAVKTYLSPHRRRYLLTHWYDVIIVVVPFLRPLRALRALRLIALLVRAQRHANRLLGRHALHYSILVAAVFVIGAAGIVALLESGSGGDITDFGESLWWAAATVTTVGYGDTLPITTEGRVLGVVLMFIGIGLFSLVTANIAAFFIAPDTTTDGEPAANPGQAAVLEHLQRLEDQIVQLRTALAESGPPAAADSAD